MKSQSRLRLTVVILAMLFMFGLLPLFLSIPFARYGWISGIPGLWNEVGLLLALSGTILIGWTVKVHRTHAPQGQSLDMVPNHLLIQGPYRYSRNPMYLGYLLLWLAWTIFYGSISVLAGLTILSVFAQFILVPREERSLDLKFGDEYRRYKKQVPRWFRLRR
jgi:protein-S-isoprenylcysteine O-methyltransferase Ste14